MAFLRLVFAFILFFVLMLGGAWVFLDRWLTGPGPLAQNKTIVIPRLIAVLIIGAGVVALLVASRSPIKSQP